MKWYRVWVKNGDEFADYGPIKAVCKENARAKISKTHNIPKDKIFIDLIGNAKSSSISIKSKRMRWLKRKLSQW